MFAGRLRSMPVLLLIPAAVAGVAVSGCGGSSGPGAPGAAGTADSATPAKASAGALAPAQPFTPERLRDALLARVNGVSAAVPAESGHYASLPEVAATRQSTQGITVRPKACARAALTGFNSAVLASAPAAAVTFRVGANGVSEVLVAPSAAAAASALGSRIPAVCDHYTATVDGKTFRYAVRESTVRGIGRQARMLNVQTEGYPSDNIWSLVYRGPGFVGAVTVVGPNASELAVRELSQQAYAYAAKSLA